MQCKLTPHWTVVLAKKLKYHDSFQLSRMRLFALQGDMTLEKGLRSQYGKDIQLHDSLGSPTRKNLSLQLAIGLGGYSTKQPVRTENISAENILILLFVFIVFNTSLATRKVRFGTAVRSPS